MKKRSSGKSLAYAIILNYNSSKETVELFELLNSLAISGLEILVIDNSSRKPDIQNLKNEIPEENLILNKINIGYALGNNVGIEVAMENGAKFIWLLNPDIRPRKEALNHLIQTLQRDRSLAAVGPRILHRHKKNRIFSDGEVINLDRACSTFHKNFNLLEKQVPASVDYDIDYVDGSSILLKAKAIESLGPLPEEYFLYFEETDWCFRARKNGWKLAVNSHAVVYNLTSKKSSLFHFYMMRNRLIFSKKYHPNFHKVRNHYLNQIKKEFLGLAGGEKVKPFFRSRVRGLISGLIKTKSIS